MNNEFKDFFFKNKNIVTCKMLLEKGYTKYQIKQMVNDQLLTHLQHGLYSLTNELEDKLFINQINNSFLIYSNETALYLHNLIDHYPTFLSVTTKSGYHLRNKNLKTYYSNQDSFGIGIVEISSPFGNTIRTYDKERTICDIIKNKNRIDSHIYVQALQSYFLKDKPNLEKLENYSKKLNIHRKVMNIVELYIQL